MKFIFLTVPAFGHLNPMLGIIKELVRRKNEVIVYNTLDFKNKIETTGAEFRSPPVDFPNIDLRIMKNSVIMAETSLYFTKLMVDPCIRIIEEEKPDCLIHDSLSLWGKLIGAQTGVPTISLVPSLAINLNVIFSGIRHLIPDLIEVAKEPKKIAFIMNEYRSQYRKRAKKTPLLFDIFSNEEKLNIVFTSDYFQPCRKSFGNDYKFVGPIIYDRNEEKISSYSLRIKRPIIYIAFGTVYNDNLRMYKIFINL